MAESKKSLYIEDGVLKDLEQDIFGHKHIADAVVESILRTQPPFTIGIFGGWGVGKSSLLDIVENKLNKNDVTVAKIDAWRYSSSDNLSRAFLIHVANELKPSLLDELHEELFYSKQVTSPAQSSSINISKKTRWERTLSFLSMALKFFLKFASLFAVLFALTFLVFFVIFIIKNSGIQNFLELFDWVDFQDKLFNLAFIPLILAIIDDMRLNFIQQPATVFRERIDADELFSQYFDKVVEEKTKGISSKKRLVIFVDNLDRLSDEKMVEALEGLRTYLNNPKCIFVIACDDNVVRSVINKSEKIPNVDFDDNDGARAGEHYLDKFFQQTFRLPEYMGFNLHDFAVKNFKTTRVYEELILQNVDVDYLISIILPSHINSPRKVKRLLNEFISLYEIVKRRESNEGGQLRPGQLSSNVEFLGKFSTLRAEYPEFYQMLIKKPGLLKEITDAIQQSVEPVTLISMVNGVPNKSHFISYIRKTETIMVDDIDSYIWLGQDSLSLGLASNIVNQLRASLVNNDTTRLTDILNGNENKDERILITQVAYRIVQSLVGIDQQNGVKVLAYLLPNFDDAIKTEVAHVVAEIMTRRLEEYSAREIINVLKWAKRGTVATQRRKLIDQVIGMLEKTDTRVKTFNAILDNADVVHQNDATIRVKAWLATILKVENQKIPVPPEENALITLNHEFAEWVTSQIDNYLDDDFIVDNYFSEDLVDYIVRRIFGNELGLKGVYLRDGLVGASISKIFEALANRIKEGVASSHYWDGVCNILIAAEFPEDLQFGINHVNQSLDFVPNAYIERLVYNGFVSVDRLSRQTGEDKLEDVELIQFTEKISDIAFRLREKKNQGFILDEIQSLPQLLHALLTVLFLQDIVLNFITNYSRKFGGTDSELLISSLLLFLSNKDNAIDQDGKMIDRTLELNNYLGEVNRDKLLVKINALVQSNDLGKLDFAINYVRRMMSISEYKKGLEALSKSWLEGFDGVSSLFESKTKLLDVVISGNLLLSDLFVDRVIALLPFSGDKQKLEVVFDEIERLNTLISKDKGVALFSSVVANIDLIGVNSPKTLDVISVWREFVLDEERSKYDSKIISFYKSSPNGYLPIHLVAWSGISPDQLSEYLIQIYRHEINDGLLEKRSVATQKAVKAIDLSERERIIENVWRQLLNDRNATEDFLTVIKNVLSPTELSLLRAKAIKSIRDSEAEEDLRFLAATTRRDVNDLEDVVSLFENLFGRGVEVVQKALKYVVQCIKPFGIKKDHKYALAEAMSTALANSDDEIRLIKSKADELELRWFKYKGQ